MATLSETDSWLFYVLAAATACLVYCVCSVAAYRLRIWSFKSNFPLPPGPPRKFIFGNAADMPTHHQWEAITRWGEQYGDLVYFEVLGKPMVFINSYDVAMDLLEKRSAFYSDRFDSTMFDMIGSDWLLPLMRYGDRWRQHRKIFHQQFNSNAVSKFQPIHTKQANAFVQKLRHAPKEYQKHAMHLAAATVMEVAYGINILDNGDPLVELVERALGYLAAVGIPGTFLVDLLPILKHVPEWFPGAGFKVKAREWKKSVIGMGEVPFEISKKAFSSGGYPPSFTSWWLEKLTLKRDSLNVFELEGVIKNVAGIAYAAGFETTSTTMLDLFLVMILYPSVQAKAQEELDRVIGPNRVPDFSDRMDLPYINAVVKELFRWHPVLPLGIPHRVMKDDVYNGYWIPKDSIVIANVWGIFQDEHHYGADTHSFRPERFLEQGVKAPLPAFGFGRRICPGRYMAENTIFMAVSTTLHLFKISKAKDSQGLEIPVSKNFTSGLLSHPEPFECSIEPRLTTTDHLLSTLTNG